MVHKFLLLMPKLLLIVFLVIVAGGIVGAIGHFFLSGTARAVMDGVQNSRLVCSIKYVGTSDRYKCRVRKKQRASTRVAIPPPELYFYRTSQPSFLTAVYMFSMIALASVSVNVFSKD